MSFKVQHVIHLLPVPYDVSNCINSFLFYDKVTGKARALKKQICNLFSPTEPRPQHYNAFQAYNLVSHIWSVQDAMADMRLTRRKQVSRLTYNNAMVAEVTAPSSLYIVATEGDREKRYWCGFCEKCGHYTHIHQTTLWENVANTTHYSPNVDVMCLCGLDGIVTVGVRRRPFPVGRVL